MNVNEFFAAVDMLEKEKGIPAAYIMDKVRDAIVVAAKKDFGSNDIVHCEIDRDNGVFRVFVRKTVVDDVVDPDCEILIDDAVKYNKTAEVGGTVDIDLDPDKMGRIVAQTAKHVIRQGIREGERGRMLAEFQSRTQELVSAVVQRVDPNTGNATLEIGSSEAVLPKSEQVAGETLYEGQHIKVYVVDVREGDRGPRAMISRTHPGLVKRLFEIEVPEIFEGTVEIKAVSREAGSRTKLAVYSRDSEVDALGACIGQRGVRVNKIVEELNGEKIDVVEYSEDAAKFIAEALKPANVLSVELDESGAKACTVTVPDAQLSLAIGNRGQNARLAAKLTGWKIDIRPESGFFGEE